MRKFIEQIDSKLTALEKLEKRRQKLVEDLRVSVHLYSLWPEAFDAGPCKTKFEPGLKRMNNHDYLSKVHLVIGRPDNESRRFMLRSIPKELLIRLLDSHYNLGLGTKRAIMRYWDQCQSS